MNGPHFEAIDACYRSVLQRAVDPSGYATYARLLDSGELTIGGLARILRSSEEFLRLVDTPSEGRAFEISTVLEVSDTAPVSGLEPRGAVAATIASKRYLANARATARSFRAHHRDVPFVLLLADEDDGSADAGVDGSEVWGLDRLRLPDRRRFTFEYTEIEASYASTPFLIDALLGAGFERVLYLKQETLVLGNLDDLFAILETHSFVLTPHFLDPSETGDQPLEELDVLRAGTFNGGIFGVSASSESREFVRWWMERTHRNCYRLVDDGLHFEQRWLDFTPSLLDRVHVCRDAGVNVGHWNLRGRDVRVVDGVATARGRPLRVFRFSGFDPARPERVTQYRETKLDEIGDAAQIFRRYAAALADGGLADARRAEYAYGRFSNGVPIPAVARRIYRELSPAEAGFGDPQRVSDDGTCYFEWLRAPVSTGSVVSNLWSRIHASEPVFQQRFPSPDQVSSPAFAAWWPRFAAGRYDIPDALMPRANGGG